MTLTTHMVTGAALTSAFRLSPEMALVIGLISHFLLDGLPHWDYKLSTAIIDKRNPFNNDIPISWSSARDWLKILSDLVIGFCLVWFFFLSNGQPGVISILLGAFGAILPDGLQFIFMKFKHEPFKSFYRFHAFISSPTKINSPWGPLIQITILLLALILGNWHFFA